MNLNESKKIILKTVSKILNKKIKNTENLILIGKDSPFDSMKLVEVCVALEDIAEKKGFEFEWTSAATMSKSSSIFRNINSLAEEFYNQSKAR